VRTVVVVARRAAHNVVHDSHPWVVETSWNWSIVDVGVGRSNFTDGTIADLLGSKNGELYFANLSMSDAFEPSIMVMHPTILQYAPLSLDHVKRRC
jgi:hypothetical protein